MEKLAQRIRVLRLTLDGLRPEEVASDLGIAARSVRRILRDNPDVHLWVRGPTGHINYPDRKGP